MKTNIRQNTKAASLTDALLDIATTPQQIASADLIGHVRQLNHAILEMKKGFEDLTSKMSTLPELNDKLLSYTKELLAKVDLLLCCEGVSIGDDARIKADIEDRKNIRREI